MTNDIELDALFERTQDAMDVYYDDETDMEPVFSSDSGNSIYAIGLR